MLKLRADAATKSVRMWRTVRRRTVAGLCIFEAGGQIDSRNVDGHRLAF